MPVLQASLGLIDGQLKYNIQRIERIFEDSPYGEMTRHQIRRIIDTQDIEFSAHNIELGFVYEHGASIPDGTSMPKQHQGGTVYEPTTRPGHRLPHAWLEKNDKVISIHDLIGQGQIDFLVITDEAEEAWNEAASHLSKSTGLQIAVAGIKSNQHLKRPQLYIDHEDVWIKLRGISNGGAILVRPDNFVAWRIQSLPRNPMDRLSAALKQLCGWESSDLANDDVQLSNGKQEVSSNGFHGCLQLKASKFIDDLYKSVSYWSLH